MTPELIGVVLAHQPPASGMVMALGLVAAAIGLAARVASAVAAWHAARRAGTTPPTHRIRWPGHAALVVGWITIAASAQWAMPHGTKSWSIRSNSMSPTLNAGDRLLARRGYFTSNRRAAAGAALEVSGAPLVKDRDDRPGGGVAVETMPNGALYRVPTDGSPTAAGTWIVPAGQVFVVGDNRNHSVDSRYPDLGPVPLGDLLDRPVVVFWSGDWSRIGRWVE